VHTGWTTISLIESTLLQIPCSWVFVIRLVNSGDEGNGEFVVLACGFALETSKVGRLHVLRDELLCDGVHGFLREEWLVERN
jgi:hypothetical protein